MARVEFKCARCGRGFKMKAHLARHLSASHGVKKRGAAGRKVKARRGRPPRAKGAWRNARAASPVQLSNLSVEQLGDLIAAARVEAHRRIEDLQKSMR